MIGDPAQTQPVGAGGVFGFLARSMPASHLTVNYRQGDLEGTHEAMASRLLREGRGRAYLESKDAAGLLHIAPTEDEAITEAVGEWAANLASGAASHDHVLIADTNRVVDELNPRARAHMRAMGRLGQEELLAGEAAYAVGDRVTFLGKHVAHQPRVGPDGSSLLREDGAVRQQRMTIPKRTRGEVIAVDARAGTLTIRTDAAGRLPSRQVVLTAQEAAGESPTSHVRLGHGYAMTVAIAQARGWSDSYLVLAASQLTGLEQTYTAQTRATRCTRLYGGADRILGGDVPEDWLQLRDQVKDTLAESLVRPTRKVTTLDYLEPGERALLEERFVAPRQSPPHFDALASPAQLEMAERLRRPVPGDATWLEASAAVDVARGHAPGTQAVAWLGQTGIPTADAWRRVASALEEQASPSRITPLPGLASAWRARHSRTRRGCTQPQRAQPLLDRPSPTTATVPGPAPQHPTAPRRWISRTAAAGITIGGPSCLSKSTRPILVSRMIGDAFTTHSETMTDLLLEFLDVDRIQLHLRPRSRLKEIGIRQSGQPSSLTCR